MDIAIIGAGNVGGGLAAAARSAGHAVAVSASSAASAERVAGTTGARAATGNADAVQGADVVVLAVPHGAVAGIVTDPLIEVMGVAAITGALLAGAYLVLQPQTHLFGMRMMQYPDGGRSRCSSLRPAGRHRRPGAQAVQRLHPDPVRRGGRRPHLQLHGPPAERSQANADRPPAASGTARSIEFRDVCFSYEPGRPILTNINLTVRRGETIALVGKNGCGKTTLLGLLPRFYDPDHGSVLIDGLDVRTPTCAACAGRSAS